MIEWRVCLNHLNFRENSFGPIIAQCLSPVLPPDPALPLPREGDRFGADLSRHNVAAHEQVHLVLELKLTLLVPHELVDIGLVVHDGQGLLWWKVAAIQEGYVTSLPPDVRQHLQLVRTW